MTARRELWTAVLLCLAGSALVLIAVTRGWVSVTFPDRLTIASLHQSVAGTKVVPAARVLGYVGLAGVLALAATKRWGRVVVGLLVLAAGIGVVVSVAGALIDGLGARALDEVSSTCGGGVRPADCLRGAAAFAGFSVHETPAWAWLTVVGGLLLASSGLLVTARGRRWAALSSSYEAPSTQPVQAPATDKGAWDALDRGDDPTA